MKTSSIEHKLFRAPASGLSARFRTHNFVLESVRQELVNFALRLGLVPSDADLASFPGLDPHTTGKAFLQTATVEELLGTIHNTWQPDTHTSQEAADPWGIEARSVQRALLDFAERFGLLRCRCVRAPNCPHGRAPKMRPEELFEFLDEEWHGRSGCLQHLPNDSDQHVVDTQIARNLGVLTAFSTRVEIWPDALERWREMRETHWYREIRHLSDHAIDTWIPNADKNPQICDARHRAREVASQVGWSSADADDYTNLFLDAYAALLVQWIADDEVTSGLYEAVEPNLPLSALGTTAA